MKRRGRHMPEIHRVLSVSILVPLAVLADIRDVCQQQTQVSLEVVADAPGNDNQNLNGEFVGITNTSGSTLDLSRWTICDAAAHCYTFAGEALLPPGQTLRVYTGAGQRDSVSYYMNRRQAVWNNDRDVATLTNPSGNIVASYSYPATPVAPSTTPNRTRRSCCRICRTGKACGNSCITRNKTCRKPPGCACNGGTR
jgi:hypothetical protein